MEQMIEKLKAFMDKAPEEVRAAVIKIYTDWWEEPKEMSPKVQKLIKVYDMLDEEEKKQFMEYCKWSNESDEWESSEEEIVM